ncbi:hypothetical protein [Paenibacillus dendrobii]|nr:hypothetical protein [Paenibacillus dendrobii]
MSVNFERFAELFRYLEDGDCSYSELQELRDKLEDIKEVVENEMEKF